MKTNKNLNHPVHSHNNLSEKKSFVEQHFPTFKRTVDVLMNHRFFETTMKDIQKLANMDVQEVGHHLHHAAKEALDVFTDTSLGKKVILTPTQKKSLGKVALYLGVSAAALSNIACSPSSNITGVNIKNTSSVAVNMINGEGTVKEHTYQEVNGKVTESHSEKQISGGKIINTTANNALAQNAPTLSDAEKDAGLELESNFAYNMPEMMKSSLRDPSFEKVQNYTPQSYTLKLAPDWFDTTDRYVKQAGTPTHITLAFSADGKKWIFHHVPVNSTAKMVQFSLPAEYVKTFTFCVARAGFQKNSTSINSERILFMKNGGTTYIPKNKNLTLQLNEITGA